MLNEATHVQKIIQSKSSVKDSLSKFYKLMRESTVFTQEALILQHNFETQLNNFLGRTIYLAWVDKNGHILYLDDANIGKVYANATANRGRGNISASKMKNFVDEQDLNNDLQKKIQASEAKRIGVYQEAILRWSSNDTEEKKSYPKSQKTFYWRLINSHFISGWTDPIQNKGIIAEGYAGAVINEDENVISENLENSLKVLYDNHIQKDSIGAAIKGDIKWKENGEIQFAVKEGSFSTARFGQYLNLAYNIMQIKTITASEFETYLPKLVRISKVTDNILKMLEENAKESLNKEIGEVAPLH